MASTRLTAVLPFTAQERRTDHDRPFARVDVSGGAAAVLDHCSWIHLVRARRPGAEPGVDTGCLTVGVRRGEADGRLPPRSGLLGAGEDVLLARGMLEGHGVRLQG